MSDLPSAAADIIIVSGREALEIAARLQRSAGHAAAEFCVNYSVPMSYALDHIRVVVPVPTSHVLKFLKGDKP